MPFPLDAADPWPWGALASRINSLGFPNLRLNGAKLPWSQDLGWGQGLRSQGRLSSPSFPVLVLGQPQLCWEHWDQREGCHWCHVDPSGVGGPGKEPHFHHTVP